MDAAAAAGGAAAPKRTFLCGKEGSARLAVLHLLGTQFIAEMRAAVVPALRLAADVSQVELFVARADEKGRLYPAGPPLADAQDIDAAFAASLQPFVCVIAKQPEAAAAPALVDVGTSGGAPPKPAELPTFPGVLRKLHAPSQYNTFEAAQELAKLPPGSDPSASLLEERSWLHHRVVGDRIGLEHSPVPVELMDPAFIVCEQAIKAAGDCTARGLFLAANAAQRLNDAVDSVDIEAHVLATGFRSCLNKLIAPLDITSAARSTYSWSASRTSTNTSDGSIMVGAARPAWCVFNLAVELNKHPAAKNDAFAWLLSAMIEDKGSLHVPAVLSQMVPNQPLFLLDVHGGRLVELRAGAWAGPCLCTEVIATAPLQSPAGSEGRKQLVRLLHGLAAGLKHLHARYASASAALARDATLRPMWAPRRHELIHRDIIASAAASVDSACTIVLEGQLQELVFHGTMARPAADPSAVGGAGTASSSSTVASSAVVVKFCRQYGSDTHHTVAGRGLAPVLHGSTRVGDWVVVVMDRLSDDWSMLANRGRAQSAAMVDSAVAAYNRAFASVGTGARHVHGDTRGPNILMKPADAGGFDVMFIDFEFAGTEGEALYPLSLRRDAFVSVIEIVAASNGCKPAAVELGGEPIHQDYDLALIEAMRPW